jgi:tetratricopeptide (TPR) repeat protein
MLAGDAAAAERELRASLVALAEMGEQGGQSTVAAALAHALIEQGRIDEADAMVSASELAGAEDDMSTYVLGQSARARILAAQGRHEEAERVARDAVGRAEETDDLNMRADALLDLGRVLSEAGDRDGAVIVVQQALSLYEAKGNSAAVAAALRRLGEFGA